MLIREQKKEGGREGWEGYVTWPRQDVKIGEENDMREGKEKEYEGKQGGNEGK